MPHEEASLGPSKGGAVWTLLVWVLAGVFVVVLVFAASSGSVRVWTNPPASFNDRVAGVVPVETVAPPAPDSDDGRGLSWDGRVLNMVVGVLIVVLVTGALVLAAGDLRPSLWMGRINRRSRTAGEVDVLPEVFERLLRVDVDAARAALSGGTPRNAIVGCWMQLERDAAAVGLPRPEAETTSEYVERVVAASSVDPAPIAELAEIYREARFSLHELSDAHRARAVRALHGVVAALRHRPDVAR